MIRKAVIIYCNDTKSGELPGPEKDKNNFLAFLCSKLGGDWERNEIIDILHNPTASEVRNAVKKLNGADYTFTLFTGHGFINKNHNNLQYLELQDEDICILELRNTVKRQTIVIDACRGVEIIESNLISKASKYYSFIEEAQEFSTRDIFDKAVLACEEGMIVLYAAGVNEGAQDTKKGAAYLLSLLESAFFWGENDKTNSVLAINIAHSVSTKILRNNFETTQKPEIIGQKRNRFFPFAVKNLKIKEDKFDIMTSEGIADKNLWAQ